MGSLLGDWPSFDPHNFSQLRPSDPSNPSKMTPVTYHPTHDRTLPPPNQVMSSEAKNILLRHMYEGSKELRPKRPASELLTPEHGNKHPRASASDTPPTSDTTAGGESKISVTEATANSTALKDSNDDNKKQDEEDPAVSNIQRTIRRAERFGIPVQLSEDEKRPSRVQRFGIESTVHGSDALKTSEEQKRKATEEPTRKASAEWFGLVQSEPVAGAAKKKTRLARFGSATKTDPLEADNQ
ncbi:unnamed protein product [Camellia sinensis]